MIGLKRSLGNLVMNPCRTFTSLQLVYAEHGDPEKVLGLKSVEYDDKLNPTDVHIKMLAAPINPADINQIQGVYPIKPKLPAVGGNEGFGMVFRVGNDVRNLTPGDHVVILDGVNSWSTESVCNERNLLKIDKDISLDMAATIKVNPPTAYRMLKDFVELKENDTVIQNGANSAVGKAVIQIARAMNVRTVNIIRSRNKPEETEVMNDLKSLGADFVFTEEQFMKERNNVESSSLALNCVGGRSALMLASNLKKNGVMVTYGGMSKQPLQVVAFLENVIKHNSDHIIYGVPTGPLIFKNIRLQGFWMSNWYSQAVNREATQAMLKDLHDLIRSGKLQPPTIQKVKLEDWKMALKNAMTSAAKKQILLLQ